MSISVGVKTVPRSPLTYPVPISARGTIGNCAKTTPALFDAIRLRCVSLIDTVRNKVRIKSIPGEGGMEYNQGLDRGGFIRGTQAGVRKTMMKGIQ